MVRKVRHKFSCCKRKRMKEINGGKLPFFSCFSGQAPPPPKLDAVGSKSMTPPPPKKSSRNPGLDQAIPPQNLLQNLL